MKNSRKSKLAELREGRPTLNNGHPAKWLVEAVGQEVADAAILFEAPTVELVDEGVTIALAEPKAEPMVELADLLKANSRRGR